MIRILCRAAAALFASLALALPASATTYSTDYTDIWWAGPSQNGWGLNLIQSGPKMFGTLFVYGVGTVPQWFVAPDIEPIGTSTTQFSSALYQTSGPYFGAPTFDPNAVTHNQVGTLSLNFSDANNGTLIYTVNGQQITKSIVRQSVGSDNLTGNYLGGLTAATTRNCSSVPTQSILIFQLLNVQHPANNQVSMTVQFTTSPPSGQAQPAQCTFAGPYTQNGRTGSIAGNWNCSVSGQASNVGTFTMTNIESSTNGFMGHFTGSDQFCSYDGQFGGVRDIPNPPQ